jgi:hypothetical protein
MRDRVRWSVVAIVLVALALRLGFVLTSPAGPLFWDEPLYETWAKLYQGAFASLLGAGSGPSLAEAVRTSLSKGEAYTAMVGVIYTIAGAQPRAVFVVQALLDTLTCLLIYGLARAAGGVGAGLVALALAAVYEPFIFAAARLQTETLTLLLYVAGLWAICVPERRRGAAHFCGGCALALAMLARPAVQWVAPVLLPTIPIRNSDRPWRARVILMAAFAGGFFAVVVPQLIVSQTVLGTPQWSGTLDPSADMYGGAILGNAGWKTDRLAFAYPPRDELLAVLGGDATRQPALADYRAATLRTWRLYPFESAGVALHKLYVAWLHPYNDARWGWLTSPAGLAPWHRIILVLGLVGMPLSLQRWRVGVPLIAAALYLWLAYLVTKIEVRYAVMPMPLMIVFAGVAVAVLGTGWQRAWCAGNRRRLLAVTAGAAAALLAAQLLSIARLTQWVPIDPDAAHGVRVAVLIVVMLWMAYVAGELAQHVWRRTTALALLAPALALAVLIVLFGRPLADTWHEWHATLRPARGAAAQEFILPSGVGEPRSAELKLDLLPQPADGELDVVVRINGEEIRRFRGGVARRDAELPTAAYYQQIFAAQRVATEPAQAWYTIPLAADRVAPRARLAVEVSVEGTANASGGVALFGDYTADPSTYSGPSLLSPLMNADTSLFKYLADGDFRMRRTITLSGTSRSRFDDGNGWSERDLALDPGRQSGRYRIFLVLRYDRGIAIF